MPYVDSSDPVWRANYRRVNNTVAMEEARFRSFGTLRYAFRSVAKNMPFIDRIVLIVASESQVPAWVNREKVRIVLHDEFMPAEHLPTFSSSAIESDMWRIEGLSERFIYGNDDFFCLAPMTEDDFFDGDLPRLRFKTDPFRFGGIFACSCRNGMDMAADAAGVPHTDFRILIRPQHCMKGILLRHMKEVGKRCGPQIDETVTVRRHQWNVTGYMYHYYAFYVGEYADFDAEFIYTKDYSEVPEILKNPPQQLCINDGGDIDDYEATCEKLEEAFSRVLSERCIYELPDWARKAADARIQWIKQRMI